MHEKKHVAEKTQDGRSKEGRGAAVVGGMGVGMGVGWGGGGEPLGSNSTGVTCAL